VSKVARQPTVISSVLARQIRAVATALLPLPARQWLRAQQRRYRLQSVPLGTVDFGTLRRLTPISPVFGLDRDLMIIDRHYIEDFLARHAADIQGRVLEMGDAAYTRKFGGDRVSQSDVLHSEPGNPAATIVADLTDADHLPADSFDCIIITQTLQMIYDVRSALRCLYRLLKPGGVILATSHGISRIARREGIDPWGEYWHFTAQSSKRLFEEVFPADSVRIVTYGNVLAATGSLHGLSAAELSPRELAYHDPNYEIIVAVRARKPAAAPD
jgi:SAM-dependent methyltransferase